MARVTTTKKTKKEIVVDNPERRKLLKFGAVGSAALLVGLVSKKISDISSVAKSGEVSGTTPKRNFITKDLSFVEKKKEVVFYGKDGNEFLIFEKEA